MKNYSLKDVNLRQNFHSDISERLSYRDFPEKTISLEDMFKIVAIYSYKYKLLRRNLLEVVTKSSSTNTGESFF